MKKTVFIFFLTLQTIIGTQTNPQPLVLMHSMIRNRHDVRTPAMIRSGASRPHATAALRIHHQHHNPSYEPKCFSVGDGLSRRQHLARFKPNKHMDNRGKVVTKVIISSLTVK